MIEMLVSGTDANTVLVIGVTEDTAAVETVYFEKTFNPSTEKASGSFC